jgi:E3 SUMO-protein ligase PIAS1
MIDSYEALAYCQLLPSVFRKMQEPASNVAVSRSHIESGHSVKSKKKSDDSGELNVKVRCPCGNSKPIDSMIKV